MMKIIVLKGGEEWSCNREGRGLFSRRRDGTWQQHQGTCDTPRFRTAQQLSRYVHKNITTMDGDPLPRMIGHEGW